MILSRPAPITGPGIVAVNLPAVLAGVALASLVFNSLIGTMAAISFLAAGLGIIVLQPRLAIDALLRWWVVLLLPAYCLLSVLWSQFPSGTLRYALQLTATLAIALIIANRVSARNLILCLFFALLAGTLVSLGLGRVSASGAWLGMFVSKNAFASHIALQLLVSLAVFLDGSETRFLRLLALGTFLISLPLLVLAQSAGALVVIGPCVLVILAAELSRYFTGPQKLFLVGLIAIAMTAVAVMAVLFSDLLMAELLDVTGKDATLTGRTDLWEMGVRLIEDNPFLGVGYRAFWVQGYAPAERLWAMFHVSSGAGFNFHNTYISNAVEIGLIGLSLQIVLVYGAFLALIWLALIHPNSQVGALLGLQLLLILRSFIEVEVFFEFSLRTVLAACTFVYAIHLLRLSWREQRDKHRASGSPPSYDFPSHRKVPS